MSRRSSESIRFIEQAKFNVSSECGSGGQEPLNREENMAERLLAYSNKYGLIFLANGSNLAVISLPKLEETFQSGEEQSFDDATLHCNHTFPNDVKFISLSKSNDYVIIIAGGILHTYHMSCFQLKVLPGNLSLILCQF
jgi:hypothetical protein